MDNLLDLSICHIFFQTKIIVTNEKMSFKANSLDKKNRLSQKIISQQHLEGLNTSNSNNNNNIKKETRTFRTSLTVV